MSMTYAAPMPELMPFQRRNRDLVDRKTRRNIFNWVVIGHILGLVLPLALGILLGWFHPAELTTITLDITDFDSEFSGPSALESGDPAPPPAEEEPEIPDVTPPTPPTIAPPAITPPLVQESDSTDRPLKPPPVKPPAVKPPKIAKVTPPKVKPPTVKPPKTPTAPKNDAKKNPKNDAKNTIHNDSFDPNKIGDGGAKGGQNRVEGGTGSGGTDAEGKGGPYDARLKAYIEKRWSPPTRAALGGQTPFVRILLDIAPDGRVLRRELETGSGMTLMDDSVRRLLLELETVPAPGRLMRGKPIRLELNSQD